ncbi:MAG TPA: protein phosphatase 2C domain-containing protein [Bryobacteraceae bacterium]|nr:protein phosphatase 2C domain-containing protein [Bryobacteraceae bacterium]
MTPAAPRYLSAASSDQGHVRENNEDRVYVDEARGIFLVVDGMGGHEAGERAAEIAVGRIRARLERQTGTVEQRIREAITLANNAIYESARTNPEWQGMACVLTVAVIDDGRVTVGHVGDSRLYRIRRGSIEKITHDHSPVGEREDSGEITEREAMRHPRRNEVYRDVGTAQRAPDDEDFIEICEFPFEPDSALLLCSDGLSDALTSAEILRIIEQHAGDRWAAVRALIAAATEFGKDNVSAVLVEGPQFAASFGRRAVVARGDEDTGRLVATALPRGWHAKAWAWLICGVLIGAAAALGLQALRPVEKPVAPPRVITVTPPGAITAALESARAGDAVRVTRGSYSESIHLKRAVDLIAAPPGEAIILGPVYADGVGQSRLEGFQIRAGDFGVAIHDSDIVVTRCDISGARTAGVKISGDSRGAIVACSIHENIGPGILIADAASPTIENNAIWNNGLDPKAPRPGILVRSALHPSIVRNVFQGNGAEAVWVASPDDSIVQSNFFIPSARPDRKPKIRVLPLMQSESADERK